MFEQTNKTRRGFGSYQPSNKSLAQISHGKFVKPNTQFFVCLLELLKEIPIRLFCIKKWQKTKSIHFPLKVCWVRSFGRPLVFLFLPTPNIHLSLENFSREQKRTIQKIKRKWFCLFIWEDNFMGIKWKPFFYRNLFVQIQNKNLSTDITDSLALMYKSLDKK